MAQCNAVKEREAQGKDLEVIESAAARRRCVAVQCVLQCELQCELQCVLVCCSVFHCVLQCVAV